MKCTNTADGTVFRDDVFTVTIDLKYDGDYSSGNTASEWLRQGHQTGRL